jgi:hypothetical protein
VKKPAAADIPKYAPGGKVDFHACRVAYISLVLESGVSVKEAQGLARHSTPELTMNVYGHARQDRLADAVERVAEVVLPVKRVPVEYQQAVGAETKIATPIGTEGCDNKKWWRRRESNPKVLNRSIMQNPHRTVQYMNRTKHLRHPKALSSISPKTHLCTFGTQTKHFRARKSCTVQPNPGNSQCPTIWLPSWPHGPF